MEIFGRRNRSDFQNLGLLGFFDVKKSQNHERAAQLLTAFQRRRIIAAAQVFMGQMRSAPCMAMRFDLALIDRFGAILIVENAFFSEDFQEPSEMGFI